MQPIAIGASLGAECWRVCRFRSHAPAGRSFPPRRTGPTRRTGWSLPEYGLRRVLFIRRRQEECYPRVIAIEESAGRSALGYMERTANVKDKAVGGRCVQERD